MVRTPSKDCGRIFFQTYNQLRIYRRRYKLKIKQITNMNLNLEYQDLLYFGYDWSDDCDENEQLEIEFKNQITEQFPNVKLVDAYDNIKGYRQEVYLEPSDSDNYFSWLFGKQWYEKSFTIQLFLISEETEEARRFLYKYLKLAKEQYPEAFKPESLL